jgi:hypothetical protein
MPLETDKQFYTRRLEEHCTKIADLDATTSRLRDALIDAMRSMPPIELAAFAAKHSSAATVLYLCLKKYKRTVEVAGACKHCHSDLVGDYQDGDCAYNGGRHELA